MTSEVSFSEPPAPISDSLLVALFVALIVHAIVILSINFTVPKPEKTNKTIAVTIANMPAKKAPKKAEVLAQENQQAAGSKTTPRKRSPVQKISSAGKAKADHKPQQKKTPPPKVKRTQPVRKVVTQQKAKTKVDSIEKTAASVAAKTPHLSPETLAKQIAQLGAEVRYKPQNSEQSRIKFINSVSTHKFLAAQYMEDWRRKVERTGNMNYPEVARKKHLTGKLTMDVGIRHDGSVYKIRISRSSGYKLLDDAAKRIVRMSAPFAPFPKALREEVDVLIITRVWEFSDESGLSAQ